jgi:hypothetical protein
MDYFFYFHTVHWDLFFTHVENLKVVIHALKYTTIWYNYYSQYQEDVQSEIQH